ncbi:MAG: HAD family hydrolase [Duncaniella sp.]|nr:HAD family hydrolase [Duncaniella sp.]
MKSLVIFDLDGTLLNTIEDLGIATNYALSQCGYPQHSLSSYPMFVGNGVSRLLERALPEDERNAENIARMREKFSEYYDCHDCDHTAPYPGIPELLDELTSRGVKVAVASNKYQSAVTRLVTHFFPTVPWAAVEGQKEGVPVKPDPSIVFEILGKCPTPKAEVLYIGDSGVDMETARRACVESIGVSWGFRSVKELKEHYADHIISSPDEILSHLSDDE